MEFLHSDTSFYLFGDGCFGVALTEVKTVPSSACLAVRKLKYSFKDNHYDSGDRHSVHRLEKISKPTVSQQNTNIHQYLLCALHDSTSCNRFKKV